MLFAMLACPRLQAGESGSPPTAVSGDVQRDMLFNGGWKFHLGDDAKAKDPDFEDAAWRTLDLPHDWSIEGRLRSRTGQLHRISSLRHRLVSAKRSPFLPTPRTNPISVRFDGIMNHATVWCNGKQVGERPYGYSSFTCDLTSAIRFGAENVIAVRVNHEQFADSRWYAGSGIYRDVCLNRHRQSPCRCQWNVRHHAEGHSRRRRYRIRRQPSKMNPMSPAEDRPSYTMHQRCKP